MFKSFACRGHIMPDLEASVNGVDQVKLAMGAMKIDASIEVTLARQVRIIDHKAVFNAIVRPHRDGFVCTIHRDVAEDMIVEGQAVYIDQQLLVQSMADYLTDPDVMAHAGEFEKATNSGESIVAVAFINENRSSRSICRNVVSGCQDMAALKADCEGAIADGNLFLVED